MRDRPHEFVALTSQAIYVWSDMVREKPAPTGERLAPRAATAGPQGLTQHKDWLAVLVDQTTAPTSGRWPALRPVAGDSR